MSDSGNNEVGFFAISPRFGEPGKVSIYRRKAITPTAELAKDLITKWGPVMARPDGEDTAGRGKSRNATPGEVVDHACETAALAMKAFTERGWVVDLPEPPAEESRDEESKGAA